MQRISIHKLEIELGRYQQMRVYEDNVTQGALRMNFILCLNVKKPDEQCIILYREYGSKITD